MLTCMNSLSLCRENIHFMTYVITFAMHLTSWKWVAVKEGDGGSSKGIERRRNGGLKMQSKLKPKRESKLPSWFP